MLLDYIVYFLLCLLQDLFLHFSLVQIIEIIRTLNLLFILLHLNPDSTMRLEGFALTLGWASSGVVNWQKWM